MVLKTGTCQPALDFLMQGCCAQGGGGRAGQWAAPHAGRARRRLRGARARPPALPAGAPRRPAPAAGAPPAAAHRHHISDTQVDDLLSRPTRPELEDHACIVLPPRRCRPGLLQILRSGPRVERAGAGAPGRRPSGSARPPPWPAGQPGLRRPARRAPARRSPAAPRRAPARSGAPAPSARTGPTTMPAARCAAAAQHLPASVRSLRDLGADVAERMCIRLFTHTSRTPAAPLPPATARAPRRPPGGRRARARPGRPR